MRKIIVVKLPFGLCSELRAWDAPVKALHLLQVMDAFIAFQAHRKGKRSLSRAEGFLIDEEEARRVVHKAF